MLDDCVSRGWGTGLEIKRSLFELETEGGFLGYLVPFCFVLLEPLGFYSNQNMDAVFDCEYSHLFTADKAEEVEVLREAKDICLYLLFTKAISLYLDPFSQIIDCLPDEAKPLGLRALR